MNLVQAYNKSQREILHLKELCARAAESLEFCWVTPEDWTLIEELREAAK